MDWFEQSTTFKTTYRTVFGGSISIILMAGITAYFVYSCVVGIITPFE
jgi:hypothetical protein